MEGALRNSRLLLIDFKMYVLSREWYAEKREILDCCLLTLKWTYLPESGTQRNGNIRLLLIDFKMDVSSRELYTEKGGVYVLSKWHT